MGQHPVPSVSFLGALVSHQQKLRRIVWSDELRQTITGEPGGEV